MKFFSTIARKALIPILFFIAFCNTVKAQTTLAAGDIAFTGYTATPNSPQSDAFSFVLLAPVSANTVINFTDNAWSNDLVFRSGETTVTLTFASPQPAGTEITISGVPGGATSTATLALGGSAGTCTGLPLSLSTTGDQVIAYQSATPGVAPFTFISAILMNVWTTANLNPINTTAALWDDVPSGTQSANSSYKPTGLTTGTNCIWIGTQGDINSERNNARFNCSLATAGGANLNTVAGVRAACNNPAYWDAEAAASGAVPTWPLPSGCTFISAPPAPTINTNPSNATICAGSNTSFSFTATNASSVKWQVSTTGIGGTYTDVANGGVYSNATTTTLNITAAPASMDGYYYRGVATNGSGSANTTPALLTVTPLPVNPTIGVKTPGTSTVADGTPVSATFNAGSGGTGCSETFRYTTDGGATYTAYTPGTNISTTGLAAGTGVVTIEGRRASCSSLCQANYIALATWIVTPLPAAATTLNVGDLAFSAYSGASDEFSFVVLKNIGPGTTANFTTNGWYSTGSFRTGEETVTWTTTAAIAAGTEIKISGLTATLASGGTAGTVTGTALSLSATGDQILVYRGTAASPTFITGIHMNVYISPGDPVSTTAAAWDGTAYASPASNTNASALPTGLITGTNAIWIGTQDVLGTEYLNAAYGTCSGPGTLGAIATLRTTLNTQANWIRNNTTPAPGFPIPTGCQYLGIGNPPNITGNPANISICESANGSFTIVASGATSYQWQVDNGGGFANLTNNTTYSGVNAPTLNINAAGLNLNGYIYRCIASNGSGSSTSGSATLTVTAAPVPPTLLTRTPVANNVADGTNVSATFSAGSGGTGCADDFRYTTDGGVTYNTYTPGTNISTTGVAAGSGWVFIEGRRANCSAGCQGAYKVLALWYVTPLPAAATTLNAGDIGFTSYAATTDEFSFALIRNIGPGTTVNFTTNGWYSTGSFRTGEETVTWTSPSAMPAGTEIKISGLTATRSGGGAAGTVTGTALTLSATGDQILVYRGTTAAPTFITAIHMNVYVSPPDPTSTTAAAWDGAAYASPAVNTNASALPTGLTTGVNAIWIGTQDVATSEFVNAAYGTCTGPGSLGPLTGLRAALNNQANWVRNNNAAPGFSIPTGCNYLSVLCPAISVTNPANLNGAIGAPFNETFTSAGGVPTVTYTTASTLPNGITLSTAGVLSGTPTQSGVFPIIVRATDANGCTGDGATYNLNISACTATDQTVTANPAAVCSGNASTITVGASQPGVNYTLRLDPSNTVVAGPTASNGPAINFSTGPIVSATTYNVLAETDKYSINNNGGTTSLDVPQNAALDLTNNFTIEGWIKPAGNANFARLFDKQLSYALGLSSNQTQLTFTRHGSGDFSRPFTFVNGTWYHVACTYVSGTVEFFVNGASIGTVSGVPGIAVQGFGGNIGAEQGNFNQFNGNIDNVRIWNSVRTQAQISANQTAFLTSTGNPTLVASWWMIEGTGGAKDYSANAINTTNTGATWQVDAPVASCNIVLSTKPTVTIAPNNTITLTSGAGTNAQTVCINTPITPITYSTTGATGATFSGLPAGVTGNWAANVVTISGSPTTTVGSPFSYTITLTGGCGVITAIGTITVNPVNTIALTSAAGTNAQTRCINTAITNITYSTTGATGATFSGLPAGVTGNWAANVVTISGTPTASGTFNYTVTLTGGCGVITANGTITVTPDNTITLSSAAGTDAQSVCINTPITNITYNTTGATGATFSGLPAGVTGNWVANVVTISGTPTASGTFNYTVTLTGGCGNITATGTITVNANNTITLTSAASTTSQIVCINTGISNITYSTTGATGATFSGLPAGVNGVWAANVVTINGTPNTTVGSPFTYTVTLTGGCSVVTATGTITVNPAPAPFTIGGAGTFCQTGTTLTGPVDPNYLYQWGRSFTGAPFSNLGTAQTQPVTNSGNYRLVVTNQFGCSTTAPDVAVTVADYVYNGSLGAGDPQQTGRINRFGVVSTCASPKACPGLFTATGARYYDAYTITNVRNTPVCVTIGHTSACGTSAHCVAYSGSFNPASPCTNYLADAGSSPSAPNSLFYEATIPGNGTIVVVIHEVNTGTGCGNYILSVNVPRDPSAITVTPGTPSCSGAPITLTAPVANSYLWSPGGSVSQSVIHTTGTTTYTVTLGYGNVGCTATASQTVTVINASVNAVANQTFCNGSTAAVTFSGGDPGTVYNWTNNNTSIGLGASGSGNISFTGTNAGTSPISGTITVTPVNGACTGTPITFTITINPTPDVAQPANQVVCNNTATAATNFTSSVAGTVFNWTNNTPSIGLAASGTGNIASFTATNATNAPVVATVTVTPQTSGAPTTIANTGAILIPAGQPATTNGPATPYPSNITFSGVSGNITNLTVKLNNINHTFPDDIDVLLVGPGGQNAIIMSDVGGSTGVTGLNLTLSDAAASSLPDAGPLVSGTFKPTNVGAGDTWSAPAPAASGGSALSVFNGTSPNGTWSLYITDDVGGDYGNFNGGWELSVTTDAIAPTCTGTSKTFTYTVNPTPNVTATPSAQTICSGSAITTIVNSGNVAGTVYNWTRDNTGTVTGIVASGVGNISGSLTNTTNAPVTVTFTITPSYTNAGTTCTGTPITATVTVNPIPTVNGVSNQVVCNNAPTAAVNFTGNVAGTVYNWTNNTPSIGLAASGSGNIASFTATNATNAPVVATITVTPSYTNGGTTCTGTSRTFTITVNPTPVINSVTNQVLCNGSATTAVNFTSPTTGGTIVYNWTNNTTSIGLAASGSGNIASFTAINTGTAPVVATVTVTASYTNAGVTCTGSPITFTITVNPTGQVNQPVNQVICNNSPTAPVIFTTTTPGTVFNWTNNTTSIGLAASGTGNIASFTGTNATNAPVTATIVVTPVYTPVNPGSQTFSYTGAMQTFTVPAGVTSVTINSYGAQGGTGSAGNSGGGPTAGGVGGMGSRATGTLAVTPGQVLNIFVGGVGATGTGGFNGGGTGGNQNAGGGGGASDVRYPGTTTADRIIVGAGGGGGGRGGCESDITIVGGTGGTGDGNGVNGATSPDGGGGFGAIGSAFGGAGIGCTGFLGTAGTAGVASGLGGNGGAGQGCCCFSFGSIPGGGAGGGGYVGGGGAGGGSAGTSGCSGNNKGAGGGGAGGSSYTGGVTAGSTTAGLQAGNGQVVITWNIPAGPPCPGPTKTFTITVNPTPQVNQPANQVVCNNTSFAATNFTTPTTGGTITYAWTNNNTTVGLAASGSGNIPAFVGTNATNAPNVATVTVTPSITTPAPAVPGSQTFNYTGAMQTFTVPANITSITITSYGAQGGNGNAGNSGGGPTAGGVGGQGSRATGTLAVTPGQVLNIFVGGVGVTGTGGFNGGAAGGNQNAGGGGGASDVRYPGTTIIDRIIVGAGGGGGGRGGCESGTGITGGNGGTGDGNGANGTDAPTSGGVAGGGFGAVGSAQGAAGIGCGGFLGTAGANGTTAFGGAGGTGQGCCCFSFGSIPGGGGGGGGYVGGGGAGGGSAGTAGCSGNDKGAGGGGAGGSSYIGGVTAGSVNAGVQTGNGQVVITWSAVGSLTCTGPAKTFTYTVNPTATVDPVANQVLCNGANSTPVNFTSPTTGGTIVYNWVNNTPSIGLAASGAGNIPTFVAVNTTANPVVATITVTPAYTNGAVTCNGTPITFTITVNPPPVVNPVASQVVCNNSPTANINFTSPVSGGVIVYNWTNNTPSIGLPASGTGDILSFNATNATNAPVVATLTVTMSYSNGGITCVSLPVTFTITVNPTPTVNQPANQIVCAGAVTAPVTFTGTVAGTVFTWTNNTPSIGLAASGTGNIASFTAVNATNAPIIATITVTPNYTNGGTTCSGSSKTFTITVNPTPTVAAVSNKAYCTGATTQVIPFNGTSGNTPGTQYNWTNTTPAIGLAASGSGDIAPFVTTNTTNGPLVATIVVTPVGPTGCVGTPITFTITVNPTPIVNPVAGQVLCNGSTTTPINFTSPTTGPTGALSFQWTNSAPSIGLAANGTNSIPPFVAVNTGLSPVTALITVTPVYTNAGITCTGTSQTFTIVVNPTPTVNPVANQVLCNGSNTAAVTFTGSVFGTIYNWTNNNTSIGLAASGAGNIASFVATNATNVPQVATITVTPNYSNGVTCPGTPMTFTITVNPTPTVNPVSSQVVCAGTTVTQTFTGAVAGTVYNWTNSNTAIGLAASGTGNLNFVSTNTTGAPLTGTITVTPSYTNGGTTCTGNPQTFTITINPIPTVNAVLPQVLCNGSNTTAVTFTGAVAGTVYSWTNNNTSIGLAASGTGNIASFTATNATTTVQTATITVTPTYTNGTATCTGTPITFTISVNPTPSVTTVANQTVCAGAATTAVTITGPVAATVYSWTNNNTSIGLGASGTNTIPSFTAINTGSTPVTATITITPTFTNGGISCSGASSTFTITVNPTANVNQPANQLLCNGSNTTAVTFTGSVAGTTYSWTNNNTAIGLAASGTGNIPTFVATNGTAAPITASITVTPSTAGGCTGIPVTFTITVNPTPSVNAIANQTVCSGTATAAVTISGPVAGAVYTWTNDNPSIGLGASGIGNIPSFITINPTGAAITATITVTATYTNGGVTCTGPTRTFTITAAPLANIVFTNVPPRVCLTDTIVTLSATPAGGVWTGNGVSGGTFSAATAGIGVHLLTYTVVNAGGCTSVRTSSVVVNDCLERHNIFQTAIRIWPNPNNGRFSLQFNSDKYKEFTVKIVASNGQEMNSYEFKNLVYGQILPFNLARLAAGQYFVYVYNSQETGVFPIIIAH